MGNLDCNDDGIITGDDDGALGTPSTCDTGTKAGNAAALSPVAMD